MPEEIIETEEITETGAGTDNGIEEETEAATVETVIIVPVIEDSLSAISKRLDSVFVLGSVIAFLLAVLCVFTIVRRSD